MVFIYQTNLIRKQQYAAAMPYLNIGTYRVGSPNLQIIVENKGVGPAFVDEVYISFNGKIFDESPSTFLKRKADEIDSIRQITFSDIHPGLLISPGEEIMLFEVNNSTSTGEDLHQLFFDDQAQIHITYKSLYEESWLIKSKSLAPEPLED